MATAADLQVTSSSNGLTSAVLRNDEGAKDELVFPAADVKHFVGGLNIEVTEDNVRMHFERFGAVKEVKIMRDSLTGRSRGFGFVTMAEPSSKQRVMAEKDHMIGGRSVTVRPYTEQSDMKDVSEGPILRRKIFVGGVNPALGQDVLENYFGKYGPLEDAQIMKYPDGRSRGFGFCVFREEAACQQVLAQPNHHITPRDRVEVKPCLSRHKAARQAANTQSAYGPPNGYGVTPGGGMYDGYGYGAGQYGGYGQPGGYGGYGAGYGAPPTPWQGAEYQGADTAAPYPAGYDYSNYYNWGGYSQGAPSAAPYGGTAAAGGPRGAAPGAGATGAGREQYPYETATTAAARPLVPTSNPYATAKLPPTRPAAVAAPAQMAGAPSYNPVRRAVGGAAGPVGYSGVRRPGPY